MDWQANLITSSADIQNLLARTMRIAVLGMRPERYPHKPAYYVPAYLATRGLEIIPVPIVDRDVESILGRPVYHRLVDIPGPVDLVDVFRRAEALPDHVPDLLAKHPHAVWLQSGIRNDTVAEQLARAGIKVVQDQCLMTAYRYLRAA